MNELTIDAKRSEMHVTERRILKLIDRMCNGLCLYVTQFDIIFDYIKKMVAKARCRRCAMYMRMAGS